MKQSLLGILLSGVVFSSFSVSAQDRGEVLFNQTCIACHTIGGGRLVGPDLANVQTRRDESWIISFVQSPQTLANSGDADAVALLAEYPGLVMPDHVLSDDDVRAIIHFIAGKSPASDAPVATTAGDASPEAITAESIQRGRMLFVGRIRFENGAAACNSCHSVDTGGAMTGGSLAINLTDAVLRLTRPGVDAMLASTPFPAMRAAFDGKPLTGDERTAIGDFLEAGGDTGTEVVPTNYAGQLLTFGLLGLVGLLGVFFLVGMRGSKKSINQEIYDRQISST